MCRLFLPPLYRRGKKRFRQVNSFAQKINQGQGKKLSSGTSDPKVHSLNSSTTSYSLAGHTHLCVYCSGTTVVVKQDQQLSWNLNIALERIKQASGKNTWVIKWCLSRWQFLIQPYLDNGGKAYLKGFTINLHFLLHLLCTVVLMILRPSQIKHLQLPELESHFMNKYPFKFRVTAW